MALKFRKKVLFAKTELVYGQQNGIMGASTAMLTRNLVITPLEGETVSRDLDRPTLGNDLSIHVGSHVSMEFDVEMAGSGTVDLPVAYSALMRACGMSETINVGTDVQYDPVSANEESITIRGQFDGQRHDLLGARGTWSIKLSPQGIPYISFKFTGLWVDPVASVDPAVDFSAFQVPLAVDNTNTPTFNLHGNAFSLLDLNIDQNNEVTYRNVVGSESVQITDRAPSGKVIIEAPDLTTFNAFTTAKANTLGALSVVHGTTAGGIVQIDAAQVQLLNPKYGESDGIRTLEMDLSFVPTSTGDDEFKITTK